MTYKILWTPKAQEDLVYWKKQNKQILGRISELVESVKTSPELDIGKPERLKYKNKNTWSRRIDKKHRLVYLVSDDKTIFIVQCRFHYQDN